MSDINKIREFLEDLEGIVIDDSSLSETGELYVKFTHSDSDIQIELKKGLFDKVQDLNGVQIIESWDDIVDQDLWLVTKD